MIDAGSTAFSEDWIIRVWRNGFGLPYSTDKVNSDNQSHISFLLYTFCRLLNLGQPLKMAL